MNLLTAAMLKGCRRFNSEIAGPLIIARAYYAIGGQTTMIVYPASAPPKNLYYYSCYINLKKVWRDDQGIYRETNL